MSTPVAPAAILRKVMDDPHAIHRVYEEYALKSPMAEMFVKYTEINGRDQGQIELVTDIFEATYKSEIPAEVWNDLIKSGNKVVLIEGCAFQITTEIKNDD